MRLKVIVFIATAIVFAGSLAATTWYVEVGGDDLNDCLSPATACATLQGAIGKSADMDTIFVGAGTFVAASAFINRSLTILGSQANVDARTRMGAESILQNSQGIVVFASNVTINGFTIKGSVFAGGFGIGMIPGFNGSQILNNIIEDNTSGVGLANEGLEQAVIRQNLFRDNNTTFLPPPVPLPDNYGTGIFTGDNISGAVTNVLIDNNLFDVNLDAGIKFDGPFRSNTNITITNNEITRGDRGISLIQTKSSTISGNRIHDLTLTGPGASVAIGIWGGDSDITITNNDLITGPVWGIEIRRSIINPLDNSNIAIHQNNIFGFSSAALLVSNTPTGPIDYATCNWWGSATGPTNAANPGGTGDTIEGIMGVEIVAANFDPWLIGPAPGSNCGTPTSPSVQKSFNPNPIKANSPSTLTITLSNPNNSVATLTAPFTDTLPPGLVISGSASTTCAGTLSADNTSVILTGGSIPIESFCTITVPVTAALSGVYVNEISAGALQTNLGNNTAAASDTLTVTAPQLSQYFSPSHIDVCDDSTLTITLSNPSNTYANLTSPLIDRLPHGMIVAGHASTTCNGGVLTAINGSSVVTLSQASIPAHGSCTVKVRVSVCEGGCYINTLPVGALQTDQGHNEAASTATLIAFCEEEEGFTKDVRAHDICSF